MMENNRCNFLVIRRDGAEETIVGQSRIPNIYDFVAKETGIPREALVVANMLKLEGQVVLLHTVEEAMTFGQLKPPPNVPRELLQLYAYEVDHPPAFLRHRRNFVLNDRCERLYQGEWFSGQIVKVSRLGLEYRYTFQYDNDGLVSKHTPASKLRWPGEIEPKSAIVVTFPAHQDKENQGPPQNKRPSINPRFFTIKTATSEGHTYQMVAEELGVDPDDFWLTVVDREGHPLCRAPLDATNFSPIICKARLLLALKWVKEDPRAKRTPTPPRVTSGHRQMLGAQVATTEPVATTGYSDFGTSRVENNVPGNMFKEADDIVLNFDDVDTNGDGHIDEEEYNAAMVKVQGAMQSLELSEPNSENDSDMSMEMEEEIQRQADAGSLETLEEAEATEGDVDVWKQEEEARTERLKAVARAEQEETDKQKVCFGILKRLRELQKRRAELTTGDLASLAAELVTLGTELQQLKNSPVAVEPEGRAESTSAPKMIGGNPFKQKGKKGGKMSDDTPPWPGALDVFSLDAAFDHSNHCVVQSVTEGEEGSVEEDCVNERNAAAVAGKSAAEELLQTLEPTEKELASRRGRLNDLADEALRLHSAIAKLDSETPSATESSWYMKLHENGLLKLHTQLPVLAVVAGSPSMVFSSAWGQYQRAREGELLAERALLAESAGNLDSGRVKALEVAVETRVQAAGVLSSAFAALEKECGEVRANLLIAARNNAKWCVDEVLDQRNALELTGNRIESTAQRARAFLGRLGRFFDAQVQKESTQEKFDRLLDRQDELEEILLLAQSALSKAERRGRSVEGLREKVLLAEEQLASFLRSEEYNAVTSATHTLLEQLPELTPAFATMDPFRGTSAQGIRVRQMGAFTEVQALTTQQQRHEMLKARFVDDDGEERWCVLKGFDAADEKQLRRELGALNKLQHHRNIVNLLGVARQQQPLRWYLQLPLHPMNLRQWMKTSIQETENKEQRDVRVAPMLRGVLEGINFLHQMGEVHRDIKPENVLVSSDGEPQISDFETCKNVLPLPGTMTLSVSKVVGTGAYIAPEVLKSGHRAASDMLSFGVIMGEALLGGRQLESETAASELRTVSSNILDDEQRMILMSLLDPDPTVRPTAAQLLLEPFFRGRPQTRECGICFGDYLLSEGIECDGKGQGDGADDGAHFCCHDCFTRHVASLAGENLRQLRRREAKVYCPKWPLECKAPPFSDVQVACVVSAESFEAYVGSRTKLTEQQLASEMEKQKQQELQRELKRLLDMDENQRRIASAAGRLREMLTDKCPRCGAAWADFGGCCALSCHRCGAGFCAWCLKDCGSDAHRHVVLCPENMAPGRDLYASERLWKQSRLIRRRRIVTEYLCGLDSRGIAEATVLEVQKDLTDLGLADIVERFRQVQ